MVLERFGSVAESKPVCPTLARDDAAALAPAGRSMTELRERGRNAAGSGSAAPSAFRKC